MRQKKIRIEKFNSLDNCLNEKFPQPGNWQSIFQKPQSLLLEIGCGKGDFSVSIGQMFPEKNILGIDVKPDRLWVGGQNAVDSNTENVRFWRHDVYMIGKCFATSEVETIWITFPDPFRKKAHEHRRMTGPYFLEIYKNILKPGGKVHFKTDNDDLFDYTLKSLEYHNLGIQLHDISKDLHATNNFSPDIYLLTRYERSFMLQGKNINYMSFSFEI